ncbi:MAG: molybdenum cofactor biosynthesis protein MoaE [Calditrichaeota bacterium]|nr:MAG: molybdenum cofactor biosynthesis protein MoaE [Calditrichota bacterium]
MVEITPKKISVDRVLNAVEDPSTGAVVLFLGRVRDHVRDRAVREMEYEAYAEMAQAKLEEIAREVQARWPIKKIALVHRTGRLRLGEVSVAIAVASPHRHDAFEACRFAIDTLKETVPIWKKEFFVDGEAWVEGVIPKVDKEKQG